MDTFFSSFSLGVLAVSITVLIYRRLVGLRLPPGPRPWPVVGNLYEVTPDRFRCFAAWARAHGPIMSVWLGTTLNVVVSSAELAREVLKENDQQLSDRPRSRSAAKFSRDGQDLIWADYGPHYVKVRRVCNLELFAPKRLEALRPVREDEVTAMAESIFRACTDVPADELAKSLVLREHVAAVAFNNITRLAFGKRFVSPRGTINDQGVEFKSIVSNGLRFGASLSLGEFVWWLKWMFPLDEKAYADHSAWRDRLTKNIMREHTRAREESGSVKQHFVDALLTLKDEYDLSEDTVIGLLWDMITAGMDTTVITVEWAMSEVVRNPAVQKKVQEELDSVIGRERVMTEADFASLPYLQCVVKEALRLHPPAPLMLPHKASANVKLGGYDIPKGSNVVVNIWAIARDPKLWNDPLEFRPERFEEEDVDIKGHDFRVLPFGAGRRVCPGAQLGINLVTSMLGHLLHHFQWALPDGVRREDVDMAESPGMVTFMRTPLRAVAVPRLPSHLYKRVPADM